MLLPLPDRAADLPDWIVRFATADNAGEHLLDGVCRVLVAEGHPLWRVSVGVPTIDPQFRGANMNWWRDHPVEIVTTEHGSEGDEAFERSPIQTMVAAGRTFERWTIADHEGCARYPILNELRDQGGTDYAMFIVAFAPGTILTGTAISIATDRAGGFGEADIAAVRHLVPALGLAVYRQILLFAATQVINSYLGPMTGAKVLAGHIRRGDGETLAAAILLADLSGFTAMADREDPADVVRWLNEHLDAIGDPVIEHGGEILKFLGDGLLAVFPASDHAARPCADCEAALRAAEQALLRNEAVNLRRAEAGEPQLAVDLALHYGEVVYGNVGTRRRLDFTAIGRAINEASRIEKLCDELGAHLLVSADFALRCARDFKTLGSFKLRGVDHPLVVLTVA